jgi:hypothetical protein
VSKTLDDLAETHSCIMALLESRIISPTTRRNLEQYRRKLEEEMLRLKGSSQSTSEEPPDEIAA